MRMQAIALGLAFACIIGAIVMLILQLTGRDGLLVPALGLLVVGLVVATTAHRSVGKP